MPAVLDRPLQERALEALREAGNPFRNYFARNPDDEVCARYHVAELYAREREQLLAVVDLYRLDAATHSEVVPILGNKGAGKTHLLHSIKHGASQQWQLLVTPGTFQKGADFGEYLLFQLIDTLLGGGTQRGLRPLEFVGQALTRRLLRSMLLALPEGERQELFPATGLSRWVRRLGLGSPQNQERGEWLMQTLAVDTVPVKTACQEAQLVLIKACDAVATYLDRTEARGTIGMMRRKIYHGFVTATLLGLEQPLAEFLTDGFAGLDFQVRPSRQELILALTKALMDLFLALKIPVVFAFDQLEDLLLARRTDDGRKVAEAFFAGIVQTMHQVDGLCFLVFAERGLWNRFVPSLDGYIQDRLNNPVHLPKFGTIKALRLEVPPAPLVWQVVAARLRPTLAQLPDSDRLSPIFPFIDDEVNRIAKTEPTLRDMLQQFRHLFDHRVYGQTAAISMLEAHSPAVEELPVSEVPPGVKSVAVLSLPSEPTPGPENLPPAVVERLSGRGTTETVPATADALASEEAASANGEVSSVRGNLLQLWQQEMTAARQNLAPEGALTGATRELNAGLGCLLQLAHEHGVKVGPWRLTHVVPDLVFGDHPTYGILTLAHWADRQDKPHKLGLGLFLGRGPGKPKDLQIKLAAFEGAPPLVDQLVLLRPAEDTALSGKSKTLWDEARARGCVLRLEAFSLDEFAILYGVPRWMTAIAESLGEGQPWPNLAEFLQEQAGGLLRQLCLPDVE